MPEFSDWEDTLNFLQDEVSDLRTILDAVRHLAETSLEPGSIGYEREFIEQMLTHLSELEPNEDSD